MKRRIPDILFFSLYLLAASPALLWSMLAGDFSPSWLAQPTGLLFVPITVFILRGISTGRFLPMPMLRADAPLRSWVQIKETQAVFPAAALFIFLAALTILASPTNSYLVNGTAIPTASLTGIIRGFSISQTTVLFIEWMAFLYLFLECRETRRQNLDRPLWSGMLNRSMSMNALYALIILLLSFVPHVFGKSPSTAVDLILARGPLGAGILTRLALSLLAATLMTITVSLRFPSIKLANAFGIHLNLCVIGAATQGSIEVLHRAASLDDIAYGLGCLVLLSLCVMVLNPLLYLLARGGNSETRQKSYAPFTYRYSLSANIIAFALLVVTEFGLILYEGANVVLVASTLVVVALLYIRGVRSRAVLKAKIEAQTWLLERKSEENERLLLNILPFPIAERLKSGEAGIADPHNQVSIVFADIVDFTAFSQTMPPQELVHTLNILFSAIDEASLELGIEKIKTIGDCYMAVAGLPEPRMDHANVAVDFGFRILDIVEKFNRAEGRLLAMRVGINSGAVVAGVIGKHKFIYDLWGDAVNLASRMESYGASGRIHVTRETLCLLSPPRPFETCENMDIKGKGSMTTYLLRP